MFLSLALVSLFSLDCGELAQQSAAMSDAEDDFMVDDDEDYDLVRCSGRVRVCR